MNNTTLTLLATGFACGLARQAPAQTRMIIQVPDLAAATIEELMTVLVTTASRAPEGLAHAPARVQVVTAAQIERRGLDRRYRTITPDAYTNPESLIGAPQNPRRISVGFSLRVQ